MVQILTSTQLSTVPERINMETTATPTQKTCTKCLVKKPLSGFNRDRSSKDGHRYHCRECTAKHRSAYRLSNRKKELAGQAKRRARLRNRADHEIEYPTKKRCQVCGETKPASGFYKNRNNLDGLRNDCKLCNRWELVRRKYGLSRSGWEAMWETQGGKCAICQEPMERDGSGRDPLRAVVDHHPERFGPGCHRALLHSICNRVLPEDPETPRRMAVYVEAGVEALLPDEPSNDTLDDLFGHLSKSQSEWRWWSVRSRYKIESGEWLVMWNRQAGRCPCCQEPMEAISEKPNYLTAVVDHCHTGGQVRALLHNECNAALGVFKDDPAIFRRAARYLELGAEGPVEVARLDADISPASSLVPPSA